MKQGVPKYNVLVGEDSFGIFIGVSDFNEFDELEDILVDEYNLEVIGARDAENSENGKYQIWFDRSLGINLIKETIDGINS